MNKSDNLINQVFKNEIQIKRIKKELQQLESLNPGEFKITLKQSTLGMHIYVEIPPIPQVNSDRPITFLLSLDNKFPFVFPRVHLLSYVQIKIQQKKITRPTMSDGRDFIDEVIEQQWSPSILLYEIVQKLPKFIDQVRSQSGNRDYLLGLGKYHIDSDFESDFDLEDVEYYQVKEYINGKQVNRVFQLSNSYTLLLDQGKTITLLTATPTKDLIRIFKTNDILNLIWKTGDENERLQQITCVKSDQFMDAINSYKTGSSTRKIPVNEVTLQQYSAIQIDHLLEKITQEEHELEGELTKQGICQLIESYQKAIEYYSAISDDKHLKFVEKLQTLLKEEEVQKLLYAQ